MEELWESQGTGGVVQDQNSWVTYHGACVQGRSCPTPFDSMDCSPPGSSVGSSVGFSRQESGLPFPSPVYVLDPGIEPTFSTYLAL